MTARLIALNDTDNEVRLALDGDLNFQSVATLWGEANTLLQSQALQHKSIQIDCAQVSRSDSAGVALLLDWLRQAQTQQQSLRFVNIPAQMRALVEVASLEHILT